MPEYRDEFELVEHTITVRWPWRVRLLLLLNQLRRRWLMRNLTPGQRARIERAARQHAEDLDRAMFFGGDDD